MKTYVVYVSVANMDPKEAKAALKKTKKKIMKKAQKHERWLFMPTQVERTELVVLP